MRFFSAAFLFLFALSLSAQTSELKKGYRKNFNASGVLESEGKEKKGKKQSLWKYYNASGRLTKTEFYKDGILNGNVRTFYKDTLVTETVKHYANGQLSGFSYKYFPNGQLRERAYYTADSVQYKYNYTLVGLQSYESFLHGELSGTCRYYRHLKGIRDTAASRVMEYRNGYQEGFTRIYENGVLVEAQEYVSGRKHGVCNKYKDGKMISTLHYSNGTLDGEMLTYGYEYGKQYVVRKVIYCDGELCGKGEEYNSAGQVRAVFGYREGKIDSLIVYHTASPGSAQKSVASRSYLIRSLAFGSFYHSYSYDGNGKLIAYNRVKIDSTTVSVKDGTGYTFYPDGKICTKSHWRKNRVDSVYTKYYPNGKKMFSAVCEAGILLEAPQIWNENGTVLRPGTAEYNNLFFANVTAPVSIVGIYYDPSKDGIVDPHAEPRNEEIITPTSQTPLPKLSDMPKSGEKRVENVSVDNPAVKPFFPGGEQGWAEYLRGQIIYPGTRAKKQASGKVVVQCEVSPLGELENFKVISGVEEHPEFTTEALRVLKASPLWAPAQNGGNYVRTKMTMTVYFRPETV
jgi:TonB family protein